MVILYSLLIPASGMANEKCLDYCKIIIISDLNGSYGSTSYSKAVKDSVNYIIKERPDLVISTGDHIAGQKKGLNYKAMWKSFHQTVTTPLRKANIPLAMTPGNHDASAYRSFLLEREIYINEWPASQSMLRLIDSSKFPLYYAFSLGSILFISLDDTTMRLSKEQKAWAQNILKTQGHKFKLKIVFGHIPLFPFAKGRETEALFDYEFEQLLNKHKVNIFISGHHHAYYPGHRGNLKLISTSCLGGGARPLLHINETRRSPKSIIKLEIYNSKKIDFNAFLPPDFNTIINKKDLPLSVGHGKSLILKDIDY